MVDNIVKEGDLYKVVTIFGKTFELRYGYYDECERHSEVNEMVPIYPDFVSDPLYTAEGYPFVTQMQDICGHYEGRRSGEDCHSCKHYCQGEDLLGICICKNNRRV